MEATSDAEGSIITDESERAFFDDVPAEEYEAAASFRMEALKLREKANKDARMEEGEAGPSNKGGVRVMAWLTVRQNIPEDQQGEVGELDEGEGIGGY